MVGSNTAEAPIPARPTAGDVLLFHGNSFVSWAIRRFDGSDVNHAAIALDPTTMIEAAGKGLQRSDISRAIAGNARTYVHRFDGADDLIPVLDEALAYLEAGVPYAYQQLVLLAFLATIRKLPLGNRLLRRVLRVAMDRAAQLLNALVEDGTHLMICSEYVFRCYVDTKDPRFSVEILPPDQRPQALEARPGTERLIDWAARRPEPQAAPLGLSVPPATGPDGPERIADRAEQELEPLIERYAREVAPDDPEVQAKVPRPLSAGLEAEVTDEELQRSAIGLRDASLRHARASQPTNLDALEIDPWEAFSVVADFVTPGDLLYSPSFKEVGVLP